VEKFVISLIFIVFEVAKLSNKLFHE